MAVELLGRGDREARMGMNNRQRRAAKQRKRKQGHSQRPGGFGRGGFEPGESGSRDAGPFGEGAPFADGTGPNACGAAGLDAAALADLMVGRTVRRLMKSPGSDSDLLERAAALQRQVAPMSARQVAAALHRLLATLLTSARQGGWDSHDLGELVRRRAGAAHVSTLEALLEGPRRIDFAQVAALASGLRIAALLGALPTHGTLPGGGRGSARVRRPGSAASTAHTAQLEKVRALLAKAESTDFDAEAEALTAKAQELISRYSLARLLEDVDHADAGSPGAGVDVRRLWLDPPYVMAKAGLVDAVADANRCHTVVDQRLGFCTVVGDPLDLDAVELLVTSLLVQATSSMLRHGQQVDTWGVSRTRSFRQSFLLAFANRIGERLHATAQAAVRESVEQERLLPALHDQSARVTEAFDALFPSRVRKETSISNRAGYAAGRAAADLASLDVHERLTG